MEGVIEMRFAFFMILFSSLLSFELSFLSKDDKGPIIEKDLHLIQSAFGATSFIETGTYSGRTASLAAQIFPFVYTVEIYEPLYQFASKNLALFPNVHCYFGDSVQFLPKMIQDSFGKRVYWLDAHYCGQGTGGPIGTSPLLQEIDQILSYADLEDICLINDLNGHTHMDRRLTDPLRQVVQKIQAKDPDYCFYGLGDIGLIFNQRVYPEITISSFSKAATISRLFDPRAYDLESVTKVIESEEYLSKIKPNSQEGEVFFSLRRYLHENPKHDGGELLYRLWLALADLEQKNYPRAISDLRVMINSPFLHWRIITYYIKALFLGGSFERAKHLYRNARYQKDTEPYRFLVTKILGEELEEELRQ